MGMSTSGTLSVKLLVASSVISKYSLTNRSLKHNNIMDCCSHWSNLGWASDNIIHCSLMSTCVFIETGPHNNSYVILVNQSLIFSIPADIVSVDNSLVGFLTKYNDTVPKSLIQSGVANDSLILTEDIDEHDRCILS